LRLVNAPEPRGKPLVFLVARDIGFVFVTGYDDHGLFAYRDRPTLKKPFQIDALKRCCKNALSSH
jgi:hypothetical protein